MEPENYLRLRSEDVIALAEEAADDVATPSADTLATGLQDLLYAGLALSGAGLLAPARVEAVLAETADALAVRGIDWLVTALPDLDGSAEMGRAEGLDGVVAVGRVVPAPDGSRVLTSVELWRDRGVLRFVDDERTDSECVLRPDPIQGWGAQPLIVEMTAGRAVTIEVRDASTVGSLSVRSSRAGAGTYLEWLAWQQLAEVRRWPTVETMNDARARLEAAAGAFHAMGLVGQDRGRTEVGGAFHAALVGAGLVEPTSDVGQGPPPEWARMVRPAPGPPGLREVVAVASRLPTGAGGWVIASLEDWEDHWRLVAAGFPDSPSCVWTAIDDEGRAHAGAPVADFAIRFDPELRPGWRSLTVSVLEVGEVLSVEIRR